MERKVDAFMCKHQMVTQGDHITLGVSGGADSVALLLFFCSRREKYNLTLQVVHVHHGIREEADNDAEYVEELCKKNNVPFNLVRENVPVLAKKWKVSEEEAGRRVRYDAMRRVAGKGKIAVAHHQSDQAETVLHNIFRGTGLLGLRGMLPVSGNIIRPFLCVTREEIENYLEEKGSCYVTDVTNQSDEYTRNRIRHHILDYARHKINSRATEHVAQTAELLRQTCDFVDRLKLQAYSECKLEDQPLTMDVQGLMRLDPFLRTQVLLFCVEQVVPGKRDFGGQHVRLLEKLLVKEGEKRIDLPGNLKVTKRYQKLFFENKTAKLSSENRTKIETITIVPPYEVKLSSGEIVEFSVLEPRTDQNFPKNAYTKWFDYDKIEQIIQIRTRQIGDYLCIDDKLSKKTIKEYFIQEKIPKMMRDQIWLLADGSHVMWVPGYRISAKYKVDENTKRILAVNLRGGH